MEDKEAAAFARGYELGIQASLDSLADLRAAVAQKNNEREAIYQGVRDILQRALAGYTTDYKYTAEDGKMYVRWGAVEEDIKALFYGPRPVVGEGGE